MDAVRIVALGGLGEVGKNMTVYQWGDDVMVVDSGLAFPRDEHLGVDLVLPDFGYLRDRRVRAVLLTHGHEDHVGCRTCCAPSASSRCGRRDSRSGS